MPSRNWQNGSTNAWRKIRATVLARDNHTCQLQYPHYCLGAATQVHHTAPRTTHGDNPAYLLAACQPCNHHAGDPTRTDPTPRSNW